MGRRAAAKLAGPGLRSVGAYFGYLEKEMRLWRARQGGSGGARQGTVAVEEESGGLGKTGNVRETKDQKPQANAPNTSNGLRNPHKGKDLQQVQEEFEQQARDRELIKVYTDPLSGSVAYENPKTGYSYNADTELSGKTGQRVEPPHVDVNYPNPKPKNVPPKRKFFPN